MNTKQHLSDFDHPTIINLASRLTLGKSTLLDKIESLFLFVRDQVKFGFPPTWDEVPASETIYYGLGYCNTKATLFIALCRASAIPARVHFGLIDLGIMRGILPSLVFPFMPRLGSHSWSEVQLDGEWKPVDSYINDKEFYTRALKKLSDRSQSLGYSISLQGGKSSCELNFGERGFVHMGAVQEDHGVWDDSADYFATDRYVRFTQLQKLALPIVISMSNRNIARLRGSL